MKRATWRSARQHVKAVRTCDTERLEQILAEAAAAFPGCAERVLAVLIHVRAFSLADALDCMKAAGFRVGHALLTLEVFLSSSHAHDGRQSEARLTLADFELAFTFWDKLEDAVKAWLSVSFVRVWQSPAGAGLPGPLLFRLKELWQHTPPTAKQRLPPARACGLGRSKEETFDLLDSHVDLNGDTTALVGELLSRGFLPPDETLGSSDLRALHTCERRLFTGGRCEQAARPHRRAGLDAAGARGGAAACGHDRPGQASADHRARARGRHRRLEQRADRPCGEALWPLRRPPVREFAAEHRGPC